MKTLAFLAILILLAVLSGLSYLHIYHYVPYVGAVHYFCSRSGTEYVLISENKSVALSVDRAGNPISCEPSGFTFK